MKPQNVRRLKDLAILALVVVVCGVVVLKVHPVRWPVERFLRRIGIVPAPVRPGPTEKRPRILPANRVSARRQLVAALHRAYARRDFEEAAFLNAVLAQEAFQRAWRTQQAWRAVRDPETGLIPTYAGSKTSYWRAKDTAADGFPFMLMAALYLDRAAADVWLSALAREREISGPMPRSIRFRPTRVVPQSPSGLIYGASEYAKDGLLAVSERFGRGPWFDRLEEVSQALIEAAYVKTKFGKICAYDTEVNGEMLQVLCRLYWATRREAYLEMAERIGDAYFFEVLPENGWLPALVWDFPRGRVAEGAARIDDHGNEIIPGLVELYLLEKALGRPKAEQYREPLERCLDEVLDAGRDERGLWCRYAKGSGEGRRDVSDTWGYVSNAFVAFDVIEGGSKYAGEIERTMRAVSTLKSFPWEGRRQDGYADAIESMLYLLPWFDVAECHRWVDDEIEVLFGMQFPSGFVDKHYLDGNFIRTALLYATYKTRGVLAEPWREDLCLGAAWDPQEEQLYLYVGADEPWKGRLRFDVPRHRTIWRLPFNYPRLNATPEWFVVEPEAAYVIMGLGPQAEEEWTGEAMAEGVPVEITDPSQPVRLRVSRR